MKKNFYQQIWTNADIIC